METRIRFHGHTGEEPEHEFRDGDELTASEAYGGKSGTVVGTQGRSYVMLRHVDGSEGIYHFSDLNPSAEAEELEEQQEVWSSKSLLETLSYLGYGRKKAEEMAAKLEEIPQLKEYVMSGVISSRVDLESVIQASESKSRQKLCVCK